MQEGQRRQRDEQRGQIADLLCLGHAAPQMGERIDETREPAAPHQQQRAVFAREGGGDQVEQHRREKQPAAPGGDAVLKRRDEQSGSDQEHHAEEGGGKTAVGKNAVVIRRNRLTPEPPGRAAAILDQAEQGQQRRKRGQNIQQAQPTTPREAMADGECRSPGRQQPEEGLERLAPVKAGGQAGQRRGANPPRQGGAVVSDGTRPVQRLAKDEHKAGDPREEQRIAEQAAGRPSPARLGGLALHRRREEQEHLEGREREPDERQVGSKGGGAARPRGQEDRQQRKVNQDRRL